MSLLTPSESAYGRCDAHHGRHGTYLGRCVLVGSEAPRPFTFRAGGNCGACGAEIDLRYERGKRSAVVLLSGTDTPHGHSQAAGALDAHELAEAIVLASRAARQAAAPDQQAQQAAPAPSAAPSRPRQPPAASVSVRGIPEFDRDG